MKKHYRITWEYDVWAESPQEAAEEALRVQRDIDSIATIFTVCDADAIEEIDVEGAV